MALNLKKLQMKFDELFSDMDSEDEFKKFVQQKIKDEADQFTQPAGVAPPISNEASGTPEVKGYSREQVDAIKDVLIKSKGALEYAAFNYDGSKLENLRPGLLDSTGVSDSCLISVREINHLLSSLPTPSTDKL